MLTLYNYILIVCLPHLPGDCLAPLGQSPPSAPSSGRRVLSKKGSAGGFTTTIYIIYLEM